MSDVQQTVEMEGLEEVGVMGSSVDMKMATRFGLNADKWVSVKEPPKEDGRYLVYIPSAWGYQVDILYFAKNLKKTGLYEFHYLKRRGWYNIDGEYGAYERRDVSHWMPLPEPPKGE